MKHLFRLLLLLIAAVLISQGVYPSSNPDSLPERKVPDRFLILGIGITMPMYRDFASSPLFYQGVGTNTSFARLCVNERRENFTEFDINANTLFDFAPVSDYFQVINPAFLVSLNFYHHYLHKIKSVSVGQSRISVGGTFHATQNIRVNSALMNAATGLEAFANLMVSGKISRDISRHQEEVLNVLGIGITRKPLNRHISFQLNVGLLNFNKRPGYAFVYESEMDGTNTSPFSWLSSGYSWSMNGWRIGTRLEYTKYRPNGNGRQWAYIWDVLSAPGKHESFQMASHRIQYAIIINNNKH